MFKKIVVLLMSTYFIGAFFATNVHAAHLPSAVEISDTHISKFEQQRKDGVWIEEGDICGNGIPCYQEADEVHQRVTFKNLQPGDTHFLQVTMSFKDTCPLATSYDNMQDPNNISDNLTSPDGFTLIDFSDQSVYPDPDNKIYEIYFVPKNANAVLEFVTQISDDAANCDPESFLQVDLQNTSVHTNPIIASSVVKTAPPGGIIAMDLAISALVTSTTCTGVISGNIYGFDDFTEVTTNVIFTNVVAPFNSFIHTVTPTFDAGFHSTYSYSVDISNTASPFYVAPGKYRITYKAAGSIPPQDYTARGIPYVVKVGTSACVVELVPDEPTTVAPVPPTPTPTSTPTPTRTPTRTPTPLPPTRIVGRLFYDYNADGVWNYNDAPIEGVKVIVKTVVNGSLQTVYSGTDGAYYATVDTGEQEVDVDENDSHIKSEYRGDDHITTKKYGGDDWQKITAFKNGLSNLHRVGFGLVGRGVLGAKTQKYLSPTPMYRNNSKRIISKHPTMTKGGVILGKTMEKLATTGAIISLTPKLGESVNKKPNFTNTPTPPVTKILETIATAASGLSKKNVTPNDVWDVGRITAGLVTMLLILYGIIFGKKRNRDGEEEN